MLKRFVFAQEDQPGQDWLARFVAGRDETERWYLGQGREPPPPPGACRAALGQHMPELLPHYDRVCGLVGDDALAHSILSHFRPAAAMSGCSQAVWLGDGGPALVRNYDFPLDIVTDRFEATSWFGRQVIAKAQRPWGGCIDGMNEDGLVVALNFGGSPARGLGFSIILVLRYVLETCRRVDQAIVALTRIPIALSQNVTLLDSSGAYATVFLGPDRVPAVTMERVSTNHQEHVVWPEHAESCATVERQQYLMRQLVEPGMTLQQLTDSFFEPPLYSRRAGSPTVYTAVFQPCERQVHYIWPGKSISQRIGQFVPEHYTHDYGDLTP